MESFAPAYGSVFTRRDCARSLGVELLSQTDMFAAEPAGRVIRRDSMPVPERHLIRPWQVLIAGAGTLGETELYGRPVISDSRLEGKFVGPHAMALTFKDAGSVMNLYTYAFLLTRTGIGIVRSASYGTKVLSLRSDILANMPVPDPPGEVAERVANLIRTTVEHREAYVSGLKMAREVLEDLPEFIEARRLCSARQARCLAWNEKLPTLGAWNYASAGESLPFLKRIWTGRLGDVVPKGEIYYGPRFARIPCSSPHGIPFLSQRDVFLIRPVPRRIVHPGFLDRMLFVKDNTMLIAGHGTTGEGEIFGKVAIPCGSLLRSAFTQDILRVNLEPAHYHVAYAFLSTTIGLRLLQSTAVGTKIMTMRSDLMRELPFPDVGEARASKIRQLLTNAINARDRADTAESEAVSILENEVLPKWLA